MKKPDILFYKIKEDKIKPNVHSATFSKSIQFKFKNHFYELYTRKNRFFITSSIEGGEKFHHFQITYKVSINEFLIENSDKALCPILKEILNKCFIYKIITRPETELLNKVFK